MSSYLDIFNANTVQTTNNSLIKINLTSNLQLSWPADFQNGNNVVSYIMQVTASVPGLSLTLPNATNVSVGYSFLINNVGANDFALKSFGGANLINPVTPSTMSIVYLDDNTTPAGGYRYNPFAGGGTAITAVGYDPAGTSGNIVVSPAYLSPGNPITTSGVFSISLGADLGQLAGFGLGSQGIACRIGTNSWRLRSIAGTANQINIGNAQGVLGNPTISLAQNIVGPISIQASNIIIGGAGLDANTIRASNLNGNIDFGVDPYTGTGVANFVMPLTLNAVGTDGGTLEFLDPNNAFGVKITCDNLGADIPLILPTVAPTTTQVLSCTNGATGALGWANISTFGGASTVNAIAKFTNTSGALGNSGVLIDGSNNITGAASIEISAQTRILNNSISTLGVNQNLVLAPNGSGAIAIPAGSESLPSLAFSGALNTGIWTLGGTNIDFSVAGSRQFQIGTGGSSVNYLQVLGSTGANPVEINALGTASNLGIKITPKGTGALLNASGSAAFPSYAFDGDETTGIFKVSPGVIGFSTLGVLELALDTSGNFGIGTSTFDGTAANVLTILNATPPAAGVADSLQIYSDDLSAGNTTLSLYTEGTGIIGGAPGAANATVTIKVNGVTYKLHATTP